jgi:hypothetical protein
MSNTTSNLGKYAFVPWLRQGISTQTNATDGQPVTLRASVHVDVSIGGGSESATPIGLDIALFGPSDVKAFDTRAIVRHWPTRDVFEVEPNYFPLLELFPADVAWRYTPVRANAQSRLRPWLALIVLRDDEIDSMQGPTSDRASSKLKTNANAPLPLIDQLWAWAHVHVDGMDAIDPAAMDGLLASASHQVVARLLCPRRLDAKTTYTAFLVPTLEATRLAALGQKVDTSIDATLPAWKNDGSAVELPVFYSWRFATSDTGDFETLARRIVAQALPKEVGTRPMDVSNAGMGLPAAASTQLAVESALRALDSQSTAWDSAERQAWTTPLATLLNLADQRLAQAGAPRTLVPPLYGRWYAATGMLDPAGLPPWFDDLNADPRLRVASALGWRVVQDQQQQLLAGAWAQVERVREANEQLRNAQLAREAAIRMYERNVLVMPSATLTAVTQALHARVLLAVAATPGGASAGGASGAATQTLRAAILASPLRSGVLHPALQRIARPLGPVGVRQGRALVKAPPTLVARVNSGVLAIAPPPKTPTQMVTPSRAATEIAPAWLTPQFADWLGKIPKQLWLVIDVVLELVLAAWPSFSDPTLRGELVQLLTEVQQVLHAGASPSDDLKRRIAARDGTLTSQQILAAPPAKGFVAAELLPDGTLPPATANSAPEDTRFRFALAAAFDGVNVTPTAGEVLRPINLDAVANVMKTALDPRVTVAASILRRVGVTLPWHPPDPLDQVMAAPTFPQPLYRYLYGVSPDWLLPGFDALPRDVVSLAHTNERFIEAFMLGANDEMGRTLLFNEYPTDQRGTYFRQFWDVSGVPNPEPDINPITAWPKTAALGQNSTRPGIDSYLVLILRAELLRRYPNMLIYAVQAAWNPDGSRSVPKTNPVELQPEFNGKLGLGAGFWGFKLDIADARGAPTPAQGAAGWYFALQEHTSEPRFGLEPAGDTFGGAPTGWQTIAWSDLATSSNTLAQIPYVDLGAALPNVGAIVDPKNARWHVADGARASDLAYITYREPVRLLVHASRMIPADA